MATANPQNINYIDRSSISVQEINILAPLRDRFDQIYVSLDEFNEQTDWEYANKRMRYTRSRRPHNYNFIRKYLIYAQGIKPVLTPEAAVMLPRFWIELRKQKLAGKRMLESVVRIAEATAKLRLKTVIDTEIALEVQESIGVMETRLGLFVKTVQDPRDAAIAAIKEIVENTKSAIAFEEAARLVCNENEHVKSWLIGGPNKELKGDNNKRFREIHDRFIQDLKRPDSKILILRMSPLVVVWQTAKVVVNDQNDQNDLDQSLDNQKSVLPQGHKFA